MVKKQLLIIHFVFVMLTACFDASGKIYDQDHLVVAGFISKADDWVDFDKVWRERLRREGKSYFHRSEYGKVVKKGTERERFLLDLIEIIKSHSYRKFGCIVPNKLLQKTLSPEIREHFYLHSFVMASLVTMSQIVKWAHGESGFREKPIRWVFEDGDEGKGLLQKAMRQAGEPALNFEEKKDKKYADGREIKAFTPLQAADFLAYELFQVGKQYADVSARSADYNYAFIDAFSEKQGEPCYLTEDDLKRYEEILGLQKITYEWALSKRL